MDENKLKQLLQKVIKATEAKKLDWQKNTKSETSFKAILGSNTLHIIKVDEITFAFLIINEDGDQIGSIQEEFSTELENLYDLAKRRALRIDENLEDIDSLLDSLL